MHSHKRKILLKSLESHKSLLLCKISCDSKLVGAMLLRLSFRTYSTVDNRRLHMLDVNRINHISPYSCVLPNKHILCIRKSWSANEEASCFCFRACWDGNCNDFITLRFLRLNEWSYPSWVFTAAALNSGLWTMVAVDDRRDSAEGCISINSSMSPRA